MNNKLSHHWTLQSSEGENGIFTIVDRMNRVVGTVEFWGGPDSESARVNSAAIESAPSMVRLLRTYVETGALDVEWAKQILAEVDAMKAPHIDTAEEIAREFESEMEALKAHRIDR
jgi:hypothetical protein